MLSVLKKLERTLTERIATRIRRGKPRPTFSVDDATIVKWAEQYSQSFMKKMK